MNKLSFSPETKKLSTLIAGLGDCSADVDVQAIVDDTRYLNAGDVFLCLPRAQDVDALVKEAVVKGAAAIVIVGTTLRVKLDVPTVCLADMQAAGLLLRRWFETEHCNIPCIGITGTDGKTSTAWMLREILEQHRGSAWSCGTLGLVRGSAEILDLGNTTPSLLTLHTLLAMAQDAAVGALVLEVSSHGIAQERIAGLPFTAAIWTTLGHDHLEDHGGLEAYTACKANFVGQVAAAGGVVVANADYAAIEQALADTSGSVFWYAKNQQADMLWSLGADGLILTDNKEEVVFSSMPAAEFHAENFAAIALLSKALFSVGLSVLKASDGHVSTPLGRLEPVQGNHQVFIDYAHTAEGLLRCLQSARQLSKGRLLLVFGCGGDRDKVKRPTMGAIAAEHADESWLTSDNPRSEKQADIAADVLGGVDNAQAMHVCADRAVAIGHAIDALTAADILVIAGKGHESYMEIKGEKLPWSDQQTAQEALARREVGPCA